MHNKKSGQVIIPCSKLSNFGLFRLEGDVAVLVITDCQYGEKTMYGVSMYTCSKPNLTHIAERDRCYSSGSSWQCLLHSAAGHMEIGTKLF